ncbi:MAG: hypothetical protein AAFR29_04380 [Pseudomonadota bacterium]
MIIRPNKRRAQTPKLKTSDKAPNHILYKDRRFTITPADIRTGTAFYPISDIVGRVRRDILIMATAFAAIIGVAMWR